MIQSDESIRPKATMLYVFGAGTADQRAGRDVLVERITNRLGDLLSLTSRDSEVLVVVQCDTAAPINLVSCPRAVVLQALLGEQELWSDRAITVLERIPAGMLAIVYSGVEFGRGVLLACGWVGRGGNS